MTYIYKTTWSANSIRIDTAQHGVYVRIADDSNQFRAITLPADERREAAQALAGDRYRVVLISEYELTTDRPLEQAHEDLDRILDALGLDVTGRPYSPHECVTRDVLPAIDRLKQTASMPTWERELLAGQAAQEEIEQLKRDYDALEKRLREAERHPDIRERCPACNHEPDRPEPVSHFDVRPGDRVEVEHDGPPSWRWEAVADNAADEDGLWLSFHPGGTLLVPHDATVRVLHAAEPEPDEAAVEALYQVHEAASEAVTDEGSNTYRTDDLIRELVRRNVRVVSE